MFFNFSHTIGYSKRGQDILSVAHTGVDAQDYDLLGNRYTVLSYGNGPGYNVAQRENLNNEVFSKYDAVAI